MAYHPLLDEIQRARLPIRPDVLSRWKHVIQYEVIPQIEALEAKAETPKKAPKPEREAVSA